MIELVICSVEMLYSSVLKETALVEDRRQQRFRLHTAHISVSWVTRTPHEKKKKKTYTTHVRHRYVQWRVPLLLTWQLTGPYGFIPITQFDSYLHNLSQLYHLVVFFLSVNLATWKRVKTIVRYCVNTGCPNTWNSRCQQDPVWPLYILEHWPGQCLAEQNQRDASATARSQSHSNYPN